MSAEAWVGVAAAALALMTAVATGLIYWMSQVHWMLSGIKQELVSINERATKADTQADKFVADIHRLKTRVTLLEAHLKLTAGGTWREIPKIPLADEDSDDTTHKELTDG